MRLSVNGVEKLLALGTYSDVSLKCPERSETRRGARPWRTLLSAFHLSLHTRPYQTEEPGCARIRQCRLERFRSAPESQSDAPLYYHASGATSDRAIKTLNGPG
jgi:hypothetical protein